MAEDVPYTLSQSIERALNKPAGTVPPGYPQRVLAAVGLGELVAAELGRKPGRHLIPRFPDAAREPEFDVVVTAPDRPPFPESPEAASGLEVALPVPVEPVEPVDPVAPDVADGLPQLPVMVTHGATTTAGPEFPEFPEFPESPDRAAPVAVAGPVFPELASPELAPVRLELEELASPVVPPVVVPSAVESPLRPEVAVAVELSVAVPVPPERVAPVASPDRPDPPACPLPH